MGKGKRNRKQRTQRRVWTAASAGRLALAWRRELMAEIEDPSHDKRQMEEYFQRLKHASEVMHAHAEDPAETFEAAWLSFARPLMRLGFASGLDVSEVDWHNTTRPDAFKPRQIMQFAQQAVAADRECDAAALAGPVYLVSPEVHVALAAAAATLSAREIGEALVGEDLPARSGMLVLPEAAPWVGVPYTRAMTWHYLSEIRWGEANEPVAPTMRTKSYVHASVFHHMRMDGAQFAVRRANSVFFSGHRDLMPCFGDLSPEAADAFEHRLREVAEQRIDADEFISRADEFTAQADQARLLDDAGNAPDTGDAAGPELGPQVGEARFDDESVEPTGMAAYLAAFTRVYDQQIITSEPAAPEPDHDAAQLGNTRKDSPGDDIHILWLRRRATDSGQPSQPGNWSHRWVVQMHKVRQWYPSEQRHKTIWRGPYIKGPAGKPLKDPRATVHALTR